MTEKKKEDQTPEETPKESNDDDGFDRHGGDFDEEFDGETWGWEGDELWFGKKQKGGVTTYDPHYDNFDDEYTHSFVHYRDPTFSTYKKKRKDIISVLDDTTIFNEKLFEDHVYDKQLTNLEKLGESSGLNLMYSLMSDIFNSLYKSSAILRPRSEFNSVEHPLFKKQLLLNKMLIRIMRGTNAYKEIKEDSTLNLLASKEVTGGVSSSVLKIYKSLPFNKDDLGKQPEMPQEKQESLFGEDEPPPNFDGWGDEEMETIIGVQIEKALKKIKAKVDDLMGNLSFWGITPDVLRTMSPQTQAKLRDMLSSTFHTDVVKLAQAFLQHGSNREHSRQVTALVKNIMRIDDDIGSVISRDKALLGAMPHLFFKKLVNRELMCLSGFKTIGRGPIICCIDDSGSMQPPEGDPAKWARAVFVSLANTAIKNRRHLAGCTFSNRLDAKVDIPTHLGADKKLQKVYSFIDRANGGGTNFVDPLKWAFQQISTVYNKADIIFITDGECDIPDHMKIEFLKKKSLTDSKAYLVLVRYDPSYHRSNVISIFDKVYHLNISDPTMMKNLSDITTIKQMMGDVGS